MGEASFASLGFELRQYLCLGDPRRGWQLIDQSRHRDESKLSVSLSGLFSRCRRFSLSAATGQTCRTSSWAQSDSSTHEPRHACPTRTWCSGALVLWCYCAIVLWCYCAIVLLCYGRVLGWIAPLGKDTSESRARASLTLYPIDATTLGLNQCLDEAAPI